MGEGEGGGEREREREREREIHHKRKSVYMPQKTHKKQKCVNSRFVGLLAL